MSYIERAVAIERARNELDLINKSHWSADEIVDFLKRLPAADVAPVDREFEFAIISAERYACGRRTYIVGATVDYIISLLPKLSDWCVAILRRDLQDQQAMVERTGDKRLWGDECDERAWARLIAALGKMDGGVNDAAD